jgi:hypothetical protein
MTENGRWQTGDRRQETEVSPEWSRRDRRQMTEVTAASVSKRVLIKLSDHQEIRVQYFRESEDR